MSKVPHLLVCIGLCLLSPSYIAAAEISRFLIEVTRKGDITVSLEQAADEEYEPAEGKEASLFGVPGADTVEDDGFFVITHKFESAESAEALGEGMSAEMGVLVADTGSGSDGIGPRATLRQPRQFGLPFTVIADVVRHGSIRKSSPSQAGRSLNFNLGFRAGEQKRHLYVTFQPTDTKYGQGIVAASWSEDGSPLAEIGKSTIQNGTARLRLTVSEFPAEARLGFWLVVRGDNAHFKRLRFAGPLAPAFGFELEGTAGRVAVKQVLAESPAETAGIQAGDRIVSIAGERVRDVPTALDLLSRTALFTPVEVVIRRGEKTSTLSLTPR